MHEEKLKTIGSADPNKNHTFNIDALELAWIAFSSMQQPQTLRNSVAAFIVFTWEQNDWFS